MLVTLDGRNVSGLPTDAQGRSYLDMSSDVVVWRTRIPIASGLTTGQHVLRLTVDDQATVSGGVDAFEVNAGRPPAFPTALVAILGTGLLIVGALLVWDRRTRPRRERFF